MITTCNSQGTNPSKEVIGKNKYNTVIVVNLKKKSDRFFTSFGQYDPYRLIDNLIAPPFNTIDTTNDLKTVIRFNIDNPKLLTLGFSEFYIAPGDSLNMNFETLIQTKFDYKDTIHINSGNAFFTRYNGRPDKAINTYQNRLAESLNHIKTQSELIKYLSPENINRFAEGYKKVVLAEFPNIQQGSETLDELKKYCVINVYRYLIYDLSVMYKKFHNEMVMKDCIDATVHNMIKSYSKRRDFSNCPDYWMPYSRAYYLYKEARFDFKNIVEKFEGCDDTVKQYVMLRCFKDGIPYNEQNNKDIIPLINKFTYDPFKNEALKFLSDPNFGSKISRNLNSILRNTGLFDINDNKIAFFDVFKAANQPYVIFDFCGTWCKPCLDEIAQYSSNQHLDNSSKVKPVWLFFENDKTKWVAIIEKYHLKKENCFIVLDKAFINEFAKSFNWAQEFPHHFLFTKEGEMIDEKAASFNEFNENEITVK
jgi:hypothetical protein